MFAVEDYLYNTLSMGSAARSVVLVGQLAREQAAADKLPDMLPDHLQQQYPQFAASLLNLLHTAEKTIQE